MTARRRTMFELYSRRDVVVDRTPASQAEYRAISCTHCMHPGPGWSRSPHPIDVVVTSEPRGCHASVTFPNLLREDLWALLAEHHPDALVGSCRLALPDGTTQETGYVTVCVPEQRELRAYRGPYCRHTRCSGTCGKIGRRVFWAKGAIVERYLDERLIYQDEFADLFIDGRLAKALDLKARFPDLVLSRVPVVPEPLDGDTLPGDPGWDGVFRERPSPPLPNTPDARDRWTE